MCLKTKKKIDKSKDKKHTGKLTSNPKDRAPYIHVFHVRRDTSWHATVLNKRYLSEKVQYYLHHDIVSRLGCSHLPSSSHRQSKW